MSASPHLRVLHCRLSQKLERIAAELPPEYKLTLIARHTSNPEAGILLTNDQLELTLQELQKLKERPPM